MSADAATIDKNTNWSEATVSFAHVSDAVGKYVAMMSAAAAALTTKTSLANETASVAQTGQLAAQSVGRSAEATERTV